MVAVRSYAGPGNSFGAPGTETAHAMCPHTAPQMFLIPDADRDPCPHWPLRAWYRKRFREPLNVEVRLRGDHGFTSARRLHHGTWIWRFARRWDRSPQFPVPGDRYRRIRIRAGNPMDALTALTEWATSSAAPDAGRPPHGTADEPY
jgi:hypothetical protein